MVPSMILQPLIENAIYHGLKGGAHRGTIEIREYLKNGDLYLEVRDDGRGMREQDILALNRSLEEGDRDSHGVGNVNRRIERIRGPEYGLKYSKNEDGGLVRHHPPACRYVRGGRCMYCVLIVDDESIIRRGLRCMIPWPSLGFSEVLEAASSEAALRICEETRVDLIVTDICMPGMDGLEMTRRLLALQPEIRIVVLTGYDNFQYAQRCCALGVKHLLIKPVDESSLRG